MKRNLKLAFAVLFSATSLLLSAPAAHADSVILTLASPFQGGLAGDTFSFFATVSAPGTNSGVENLNGDAFSVDAPIALDDSGYFANFPFFLNPGDSYTGLLFTLTVPPSADTGLYAGSFSITGGPDTSSNDVLATVDFDANITPEPASFLLLGTGLIGLAGMLKGRRSTGRAERSQGA